MKVYKNTKQLALSLPLVVSLSFCILQANEPDPFADDNVITIDANQAAKESKVSNESEQSKKFDEINDKQNDVLSVIKKTKNPSLEDVSNSLKSSMFGNDENITKVTPPEQKDDESSSLTELIEKSNAPEDQNSIGPQPVKGIKYYKELDWFSIMDHNQTGFAEYVKKLNLPTFTLDKLKNRTDSGLALAVNAFAYDYGLHDAPMAENFYKEFLGRSDISFYDRELRYADFLIRTGRPQKVLEFLSNSTCMNHINFMASCDYYLGVARYLMTGDNQNVNIRTAKDYFDKARILFYQSEKK